MKAKYDCARVWTSIHAAHTHIRFSYGLLAVPLVRRDFESAPLFFCRRHSLATKKGGAAMGRIWKYKYGGSTTSSHPYCPARVLLHGRCPKDCPEKLSIDGCRIDNYVDHPRLDETPMGGECFISSHYYTDIENSVGYKHLKAVCDFHKLCVTVEEHPWNGVKVVSHIKITK